MDITVLRIFEAVASEQSISGAAKRLHYVQSNVTARIKQLETEIGKPLFYRHNRGISITETGEILRVYAKKIITLFEEAEKALSESSNPTGLLKIGTIGTIASTRLSAVLTFYHEKYPLVNISLKTGMPQQMIDAVLKHELDGAFVPGPLKHPDILQEKLLEEELVLINGVNPFQNNESKSFKQQPLLVLPAGCRFRSRLVSLLSEEGFAQPQIMELGSLDTVIGCVRAGMGISLVPKSVVDNRNDKECFIIHTVPKKFSKIPILFIWNSKSFLTITMKKFIETALNHFNDSNIKKQSTT